MSDVTDDGSISDDDQDAEVLGQFDDEDVLPDNDRPYGVQRHGTTELEEAEGAGISLRVQEEEPDPIASLSYDFPDETSRPTVENTTDEDDPSIDVPDEDSVGVGHLADEVVVVGHVEAGGLEAESDDAYAASGPTEMLERSEGDQLEAGTDDEPTLPTPH